MPSQKIQRWIDLLAALLRRRFPVTLEELSLEVPGYMINPNKTALRRTFERDKDELRAFGIPIETVTAPSGEAAGYRLQPQHFYLPYLTLRSVAGGAQPKKIDRYGYRTLSRLTFEPDQLSAVVDAAARVRQLGDPLLAEHVDSALRKLAADLPVDASASPQPEIVPPRAKPNAELLATLAQALEKRKRITFSYLGMSDGKESHRFVEPFGLFFLISTGIWPAAPPATRRSRITGSTASPTSASTRNGPTPTTTPSRPTSISGPTPAPGRLGSWAPGTRSRPWCASPSGAAPQPRPSASAKKSREPLGPADSGCAGRTRLPAGCSHSVATSSQYLPAAWWTITAAWFVRP